MEYARAIGVHIIGMVSLIKLFECDTYDAKI